MDKSEEVALLMEYVKSKSLIHHCLTTVAVMQGLTKEPGEGDDLWKSLEFCMI